MLSLTFHVFFQTFSPPHQASPTAFTHSSLDVDDGLSFSSSCLLLSQPLVTQDFLQLLSSEDRLPSGSPVGYNSDPTLVLLTVPRYLFHAKCTPFAPAGALAIQKHNCLFLMPPTEGASQASSACCVTPKCKKDVSGFWMVLLNLFSVGLR